MINAPTTRETPDLTSLHKVQTSADHIGEANDKVGTMIDHAELSRLAEAERDAATFLEASLMREALQKRLTAPVVLALLSEIAALRGERDTWKAMAENGAGGIIAHINRATQAERQRDEAVGLLRDHDDVTRAWDIEPEPGSVSARARAFLANQGADQ